MKSESNAGHFDLEGEREKNVELTMSWKEESQVLNSEEHHDLQSRQKNRVAKGFEEQQYVSEVQEKSESTPILKTEGKEIF